MADSGLVRHRDRLPDEISPVSIDEQARLLNDPAIPLRRDREASEFEALKSASNPGLDLDKSDDRQPGV